MIPVRNTALAAALIFSTFAPLLHGRAQDRIAQRIDDTRLAQLRGNVHPLAQPQFDQGRLSPGTVLPRIVLHFNRTAAQQAELERLLQEQQDPGSPNYHQWVTPELFADRFGMSESDLARVTDWLQGRGFAVVERARSRSYVAFRGSVGQVDSVLRTEIHRYAVNGEEHFANASEPVVPEALVGVVQSIRGLNDFAPRAHGISARPRLTSYLTGNHFLAPEDIATIYNLQPLYKMGIDGTGVNVVVIGQSDFTLSDIQTFRRVSGFPANDPQKVLVPGSTNPGIVSGDVDETSLDLEWVGAVARGATVIYVYASTAANGAFGALTYAVDQNLAPVLSSSYGNCETNLGSYENTLASIAQQANAQGMTITSASGDAGAADCDPPQSNPNETLATLGLAVDVPAALPTVTGVGGTTFNDGVGTYGTTYWSKDNDTMSGSALSYIPEVVWNDSGVQGATGGGVSGVFAKPNWQAGTGVPNDGFRDVPDVALAASPGHDPYLICSGGSCVDGYRDSQTFFNTVGGTSAGSPTFAGMVVLMNHYTGSAQGNINPRLYQLAAISPDAFHDITTGNNNVSCRTSPSSPNCPSSGTMGFSAGVGYDQATGLGSVDAYHLITEWQPVALRPNPLSFGSRLTNIPDTLAVTLRNNSPALNSISVSIAGNFTQTNDCPGTLSFGGTCTIQVTYLPTTTGTQNGTLTIAADDAVSPHQVAISGTGIADLGIALGRTARVARSDANSAPASSTVSAAMAKPVSTSNAASRTGLQGSPTASLIVLPVRVVVTGWDVSLINSRETTMAVAIVAGSDLRQENDCGAELKPSASCTVKIRRETPGATGELKITTPEGTTRVAIGKSPL